jgi:hypothetical protein
MKLRGLHFADDAEIQEAETDEGPKRGNFGSFSETYDSAKACIHQWSLF